MDRSYPARALAFAALCAMSSPPLAEAQAVDDGDEAAPEGLEAAPLDEAPGETTVEAPSVAPEVAVTEPEPAAEEEHDWFDDLSIGAFVDAYVAAHWTLPQSFWGDHSAELPQRVYDTFGGPTINLASLDVSYAPQPIGATLSLRFGTGEQRWLGAYSGLPAGVQFLHQAFVSWRPVNELQIDFGEFVTPFGAEVAETWRNTTYTLGSLFQLVQPFYHTGFRVVATPTDWLTITALAVNGWNSVVDNNDGKAGGLQLAFVAGPATISLGYLLSPEQATGPGSDGRFRHFGDVIVNLDLSPLRIVGNSSVQIEEMGGGVWNAIWGVSLAANYRIIPELGIGLREEYVGRPQSDPALGRDLVTSTLTLDVFPAQHLIVRLDNRIDWSSQTAFPDPQGRVGVNNIVASSVLSLVVTSN